MTDEERTGVRRMINHTIDRLQKVSTGTGHMGARYARLLQLLWRKVPKPESSSLATNNTARQYSTQPANPNQPFLSQAYTPQSNFIPLSPSFQQPPRVHPLQHSSLIQQTSNHLPYASAAASQQLPSSYPSTAHNQSQNGQSNNHNNNNRMFSWLDLGATWNFATQNGTGTGSNAGSMGEMDVDDEHVLWDQGIGSLDMGLSTDYSVLEGDNPNLIF